MASVTKRSRTAESLAAGALLGRGRRRGRGGSRWRRVVAGEQRVAGDRGHRRDGRDEHRQPASLRGAGRRGQHRVRRRPACAALAHRRAERARAVAELARRNRGLGAGRLVDGLEKAIARPVVVELVDASRRQRPRGLRPHLGRSEPRVAPPAAAEQVEHDLLERLERGVRRRRAVVGILREQLLEPLAQARVEVRPGLPRVGQRVVDVLPDDRERVLVGVERHPADEHLVRHDADRVEVRARAELLARALLGSHVLRRADGRPRDGQKRSAERGVVRLGDAEVRELDPSLGGHEDVLRLDVAVGDPAALRVRQAREQALEHAHRLGDREVVQVLAQASALDVLHRDVRPALVLEVVEHRDDVRMVQRPGELRLAREARREDALVGDAEAVELLQRDLALEAGLAGEVDRRHPALADPTQDLIAPHGATRCVDLVPGHGARLPFRRTHPSYRQPRRKSPTAQYRGEHVGCTQRVARRLGTGAHRPALGRGRSRAGLRAPPPRRHDRRPAAGGARRAAAGDGRHRRPRRAGLHPDRRLGAARRRRRHDRGRRALYRQGALRGRASSS